MTHRLHNVIYSAIEELKNAEKITRTRLAELSRDLLIYVPETEDIEAVNRTINVLTPMNKSAAILYFTHFLPWQVEKDSDKNFVRFGKKIKAPKQVKRKMIAITEWLDNQSNTIWTWADDNIEMKKKDFASTVTRAVKKALEGDTKTDTDPLTMQQLMAAIFEGGVEVGDMLEAIADEEARLAEEQASNEDEAPSEEVEEQEA